MLPLVVGLFPDLHIATNTDVLAESLRVDNQYAFSLDLQAAPATMVQLCWGSLGRCCRDVKSKVVSLSVAMDCPSINFAPPLCSRGHGPVQPALDTFWRQVTFAVSSTEDLRMWEQSCEHSFGGWLDVHVLLVLRVCGHTLGDCPRHASLQSKLRASSASKQHLSTAIVLKVVVVCWRFFGSSFSSSVRGQYACQPPRHRHHFEECSSGTPPLRVAACGSLASARLGLRDSTLNGAINSALVVKVVCWKG